jgi:hypothetical protein
MDRVVEKLWHMGIEAWVVRLGNHVLRDLKLHCARVFVPGLIPLYFGLGKHKLSTSAVLCQSTSPRRLRMLHPLM